MELSTFLLLIAGISLLSFVVLIFSFSENRQIVRLYMGGPWDGKTQLVSRSTTIIHCTDFEPGWHYKLAGDTFVWCRCRVDAEGVLK